jgi:hypothetical protein
MPDKIAIKATPEQRDEYVANILMTWYAATDDQVQMGREWYPTANKLASFLADGYTRMGAGIIAALSVQKSWSENRRLAADALAGNAHGHVSDALRKVHRIMVGDDPADVLPMDRKTGHFFRSIADPTDPGAICIDRHAHDIAVGVVYGDAERGLDAKGRYNLIAECYREAAALLQELPSTVQAVTWTVHTERND